jgi:putative FmdB family regulatory protein
MPLYEYKCHKCGGVFEKIQKFSDEPLSTHEGDCGGDVERLLSSPALQFKGSGFYITDYAKSGSSSKASSSSSD